MSMYFNIEDTKGWVDKCWFGLGRVYNNHGDFDYIYILFLNWRIEWWYK